MKKSQQVRKSAPGPKFASVLRTPSAQQFDATVAKYLRVGVAGAGGDASAMAEARVSLANLRKNPSLRVATEPGGPVFYEDPVLDTALQLMRTARREGISPAAEGEDLDSRMRHWIPYAIELLRGRFRHTREVLLPRVPGCDLTLKLPARIAIFGDGGYRGLAQRRVFDLIAARHQKTPFDMVVHLGDTYHGGSENEMLRHLLAPMAELARKLGVAAYSLAGNHDLYDGPEGYLGVLSVLGQPGRYFAIETPGWRIACLYSATGDTSLRCLDGKIDDSQLEWLRKKQDDGCRLIILSHHLPRSAWDRAPTELATQLGKIPGLFAWYWGHEHRCASFSSAGDFLGACVGNGAYLEDWSEPHRRRRQQLLWYPKNERCDCFGERKRLWPHGFLELALDQNHAEERFWLEGDTSNAAVTRTLM